MEKPYLCLIDLSGVAGAQQTSLVADRFENIAMHSERKHSPELHLDTTGFELVDVGDDFPVSAFEDTEWLKRVYYPFVEEMVLRKLGAKEAHVLYERQLRNRHPGFGRPYTRGALHYDPPVSNVHVDATQQAGILRFRIAWPNFTEDLLHERPRIVKSGLGPSME